jgi:hypothetical protein
LKVRRFGGGDNVGLSGKSRILATLAQYTFRASVQSEPSEV